MAHKIKNQIVMNADLYPTLSPIADDERVRIRRRSPLEEDRMTPIRVHPPVNLDVEFTKRVGPAIRASYWILAQDLEEEPTAFEAVELAIDAGRIEDPNQPKGSVLPDQEAANLITMAIETHGYNKTVRYLAKHIALI